MKSGSTRLTKGFFFKREVLFSKAYLDLSPSARDLLHCLVFELRFQKKGKKIIYINNGKVSFTENQFKREFLRSSNTYITARNRLIKNGLIKQTYRGGMARGDCATYEILIAQDLPRHTMRWLRYPKENWEKEIPKAKQNMVGTETRFKSKNTLKKRPIKDIYALEN